MSNKDTRALQLVYGWTQRAVDDLMRPRSGVLLDFQLSGTVGSALSSTSYVRGYARTVGYWSPFPSTAPLSAGWNWARYGPAIRTRCHPPFCSAPAAPTACAATITKAWAWPAPMARCWAAAWWPPAPGISNPDQAGLVSGAVHRRRQRQPELEGLPGGARQRRRPALDEPGGAAVLRLRQGRARRQDTLEPQPGPGLLIRMHS